MAVLCAAPNSVYKGMSGVDVYDMKRDARTYRGGAPIVAHPPCRSWSAFCAHQAKPDTGERELGVWVAEQVKRHGGVLEQPANSRLFAAAGLPLPTPAPRRGLFSLEVWQYWWGYRTRKRTWLFFSGVDIDSVVMPFRLHPRRDGEHDAFANMSKHQRSATPEAFAVWLIDCARGARK